MEEEEKRHINLKLCIVCQQEKEELLVENPSSHEKLVSAIRERAPYGNSIYPEIWSSLAVFTVRASFSLKNHHGTESATKMLPTLECLKEQLTPSRAA